MALTHARHKRFDLAERHLRELQREHPKSKVRIIARDNAQGSSSNRGHFYTFRVSETHARRRRKKRAPRKSNQLAFLLSFSYTPAMRRSHGGNKAKLRADFIVAGNSAYRKRDSVEVFTLLIPKVIKELPERHKWLAVLAEQVIGSERAEIDSSIEPKTKPPKKAKIRSAYRAGQLLYGSASAESE